MIRISLAVVAMLALCAWVNGRDVESCQQRGHLKETCFSVINP